jgi:hypothetical protein
MPPYPLNVALNPIPPDWKHVPMAVLKRDRHVSGLVPRLVDKRLDGAITGLVDLR